MILASSLEGAAIWKPGLKEQNIFLNRLGVYKVCCDTSNFSVWKFKQLLRSQNLLWATSLQASTSYHLLKVLPTPSQGGKPEKLCKNFFILKNLKISISRATLHLSISSYHAMDLADSADLVDTTDSVGSTDSADSTDSVDFADSADSVDL